MKDITIIAVSIVRSPLTHMSGVEGNKAVVMREPVLTDVGIRYVPAITGNALRHRLVRRPLAIDLIRRWGLASRQLTADEANWLLHGGQLTRKGGVVDLGSQADAFRLFPVVKLLGCSLPGQIVPGACKVLRGVLVCRENAERIRQLLPPTFDVPSCLRPAVAMIDGYQYTRGDASSSASDVALESGAGDSSMMIYEGQSVTSGSVFVHGFSVAASVNRIEIGALLFALQVWQASGGTIGGMAARGHGRLETYLWSDRELDQQSLAAEYAAYVDGVRDEAIDFLRRQFRTPPTTTEQEHGDDEGDKPKPRRSRAAKS